MPQKMMLVLNPVSGKRAGMLNRQKLLKILQQKFDVTLFLTRARDDATILVKENAPNYDVVACCGGDGTINEIVAGVLSLSKKPPIACIPAGTTNLLGDTLGLSHRLLSAAEHMLTSIPRPFDVGEMGKNHFTSVASFGAFADSSYNTSQRLKNMLGYSAYVIGSIKSLSKLRKYTLKISRGNKTYTDEYIFGSVSNCVAVGGVIRFAPGVVVVDDGLFETVLVKTPRNIADLSKILSCVRKREYLPEYFDYFQTDTVGICSEEPIPWTIDGEYRGDFSDVGIRVLHNAISLYY